MRTLLLYPPFAMPDKPYISIPTLAAYLKSKGHAVDALDVNLEFFRLFLSPPSLRECRIYAEKRFWALNEKEALAVPEMVEYLRLFKILDRMNGGEMYRGSPFSPGQLSTREKMQWFEHAVHLTSMPYYPWGLDFTENTGYIRYKSRFKKFSSRSIFESLETPSFFSPYLDDIIHRALDRRDYRLVGISVTFPDQVIPAMACARIIRGCLPGVHITLGGGYVSYHLRHIEDPRWFDIVDSLVIDEGEVPLECLLRELSGLAPQLNRVPNLVFYDREKGGVTKSHRCDPLPPDSLPPPDYTLFPLDRYLIKRESMSLLLRLSRGCYWGKCAFCSTRLPMVGCYSRPSDDHIARQLSAVIKQTGVHIFHITDDAACPDVLECLAKYILKHQFHLTWATNVRFDKRLTLERLFLYRESGCRRLCLGMESYSDRILKLMGKGITTSLIDRVLSNISWSGIEVEVYMIVGFPTETVREALRSFEKIKELMNRGWINSCVYSLFEIIPYSQVSLTPEKFHIKEIMTDDTNDLRPPLSRCECRGMSREEASRLCLDFIMELNGKKSRAEALLNQPVRQVNVDGRLLPLSFDLKEMITALKEGAGGAVRSKAGTVSAGR